MNLANISALGITSPTSGTTSPEDSLGVDEFADFLVDEFASFIII